MKLFALTTSSNTPRGQLKLLVMHLYIDEILYRKSSPKKEKSTSSQYRLYNLLFTGKIEMKEYLTALRTIKDESKKEELTEQVS
jgi:hypothetical protein